MGVLPLEEIIFLVRDFPTMVSELRFWPRVSNQGRKRSNLTYWPESTSLKRVEFMCGEMHPDLWRRLQMVLVWPIEWCTMEIWSVWVAVCDMCVEEVLCGLQICYGCCVWWTAMFGNVGSTWWGWSSRSPMVVFCMAYAMLCQQWVLRRCVMAVSWLDQGGVMMDSSWVLVNC